MKPWLDLGPPGVPRSDSFLIWYCSFTEQVLQGGGLESPTKPKGRPKKNSIPTSEQLTEQERAKEAEKPAETPGEPSDRSCED